MTKRMVTLFAPMYTEEERWVAGRINDELQKKYDTYTPYTDRNEGSKHPSGLEDQLFELLATGDESTTWQEVKKAILLSSALNYFKILESDACVIVTNGRTPDEGSLFWGSVAFASGIPVIVYKEDYRMDMVSGDIAMITGLTLDFEKVGIHKLNARVESQVLKYGTRFDRDCLSAYNKKFFDLGRKVSEFVGLNITKSLMEIIKAFSDDDDVRLMIPLEGIEDIFPPLDLTDPESFYNRFSNNRVYCSGGLLCPSEIREMDKIDSALIKSGLKTFLPHEDGAEAMTGVLDKPAPLINTWYWQPGRWPHIPIPVPISEKKSGLQAAKDGNLADEEAFKIDVYQIMSCAHFVINLNGSVPIDGAVAEAGMAFAMGKPIVIYKSDIRMLFNSRYGYVHPALQMGGHLFDPATEYDEIYAKLKINASFITSFGDDKYSYEIHPLVKSACDHGYNLFEDLLEARKAPMDIPLKRKDLRLLICNPKEWINRYVNKKWWVLKVHPDLRHHPYSKWPDPPEE